jgi:predicted RNase H-like HicB family nuclease
LCRVAVDYGTCWRDHEQVDATGWTEAEALRDLAELLRGWIVERTETRPA